MSLEAEHEESRITVLVADDEPITRRVLERHLQRLGYLVLTAGDGDQARDLLVEHPEVRILITDWMMPGCDGPELCRFARSLSRPRYLHILMLTVKSKKTELVEGIQAGADAFLVKPVNVSELEAQVRVARRMLDLVELNARRVEELDAINRRIQRDLEAAARVQNSFLPARTVHTPGIRCASIFESSQHVAGDMFNVLPLDDGRLAAYVLDVSGHGTQAALLSVSVHLLLESLSRGGHRRSGPTVGEEVSLDDPLAVLRMLNRRFPVMRQSAQYFTMIYGVLDPRRRTFEYGRAGHPWPMVVNARGASKVEGSQGAALGIFPNLNVSLDTIPLEPGDLVLLYSDGVSEARSARDRREEFGYERMLEVLEETRGRGVVAVIEALEQRLREFAGPKAPRDDVTALGMELLEEPPAAPGGGPPGPG